MSRKDLIPTREEFIALSREGNRIPVFKEILGDMETPLSALIKVADDQSNAFLLESVEGGERWARYSFIGLEPELLFRSKGKTAELIRADMLTRLNVENDPLELIKKIMADERPVKIEGLPRFAGGAVGYIAYDCVRFFERLPSIAQDELGCFDVSFMFPSLLLAFDNVRHTIKVIAPVSVKERGKAGEIYDRAVEAIDAVVERLKRAAQNKAPALISPQFEETSSPDDLNFISNFTREEYYRVVEKCLEYIRAGDIIQVVPSQRFRSPAMVNPLNLYRSLRHINPSPYMFFLKLGAEILVGSSPEVMLRVEDRIATLRPIAGTRRRGATAEEDQALEEELRNDPKEKAEHVMLVDLGRNDLGRVSETGTVKVEDYMTVERYSHVMHLVSSVTGRLMDNKDAFDAVRASFPAGTLTGAPKIRAMEIIEEVEPSRRGVYGGAVGYFGYDGDMDMCITIRTALLRDGIINIQAGGGVVADSNPEFEYQETLNKARGLMRAVMMARSAENGGDKK